jgi:hypothetical protein
MVFDKVFKRHYPNNIKRIFQQIKQNSGKHAIQRDQADQFIRHQITPLRQQAARDLVENTIYMTLRETADTIEQLVIQFYNSHVKDPNETIYIYVGKQQKSNYFLGVLAYYYIQQHFSEYAAPDFVNEINRELFDRLGLEGGALLYIDDVAYSGSQIQQLNDSLYYQLCVLEKLVPPRLYYLITALNTKSLDAISKVPTKKTVNGDIYFSRKPSPFPVIYLPERLYPTLVEKIGEERQAFIKLFFSPFQGRNPYFSLYLDHKIADHPSTYTTPLLFGPIVPASYQYWDIFRDDEDPPEYSEKINARDFSAKVYAQERGVLETLDMGGAPQFFPLVMGCTDIPARIMKIVETLDYSVLVSPWDDAGYVKKLAQEHPGVYADAIKAVDNRDIADIMAWRCPACFYKSQLMK